MARTELAAEVAHARQGTLSFEACIFELDGVALDSVPTHQSIAAQVLAEAGLQLPPGSLSAFKGHGHRELFEAVCAAHGLSGDVQEYLDRFGALLADEAPRVRAIRGVDVRSGEGEGRVARWELEEGRGAVESGSTPRPRRRSVVDHGRVGSLRAARPASCVHEVLMLDHRDPRVGRRCVPKWAGGDREKGDEAFW